MKKAIAKYESYFQMGRAAFQNGIRCAPANDPQLMAGYNDQWRGAKIGDEKSKEALEAMKAWIGGWNMANLNAE